MEPKKKHEENLKEGGNCKTSNPRCLKLTEQVSSNIAREASYVYIFSGQKLIKNAKMVNFASFWKT